MKPNTSNAAKFFAEYWDITEWEASELNAKDVEMLVEYAKSVEEMTTSETITQYAKRGILIEVVADCYKIESMDVCWRGIVRHKSGDEWAEADCGCLSDWEAAFGLCVTYIETWIISKSATQSASTPK